MKERLKRFGYMLSSELKRLLYIYKYYLLIFAIIFLIAFITGIMTCINYSSSISTDKFINIYLLSYLCKDTTYLSYFLMLGLYYLLVTLFVMFFTRNWFVIIVDGILLSLLSYILGFDTCVFVSTLGLSGVIFGVLIYGILMITVMLTIIMIMSIACRRVRDKKNICEMVESSQYFKMYIVFLLLGALILFFHAITLGVIHIFVIVD